MNELEMFKNNVNQIFTCLAQLDTYLEDTDNSSFISNLNEFKEPIISFTESLSNASQSVSEGATEAESNQAASDANSQGENVEGTQ